MTKQIYLYIGILYLSLANTYAQDYFSFYNLGDYVTQTQNVSPVYLPKNSLTIAIPATNIGFNLNSGFKINELLIQDATSKELSYNLTNLYNKAEETNDLNIDANINLLYLAFKINRGSLTFFINTKATNNWRYTKDFLGIAVNGINQDFVLKDQNEYTGYNEFGIGLTQTFFDNKLAVAIRAKHISGFAHSSTKEGAKLSLTIDDASREYTIIAENATINSAGYMNSNTDQFKFLTNNSGYGFDFGATYMATPKLSFEIDINDVGIISWKENVKNYNIKNTGELGNTYSGINLTDVNNVGEAITDKISSFVNLNETTNNFRTKLNMKTYISVRYSLTTKNTFTLSSFNTYAFNDFKPSYSLGYNRTLNKTTYGLLTSLGGINNEFLFGINFAVNLGPLQFYAATDSLKAIFQRPEETTGSNIRFGLNLVFGYNKEKNLPLP